MSITAEKSTSPESAGTGASHITGNLNGRSIDRPTASLDPRRARMVREVADFGFEWRLAFEAGRLVAAGAIGALLAFSMVGHRTSSADAVTNRVPSAAAKPAAAHASSPEEIGLPVLLAPLDPSNGPMADTLQRDVHSDGGGH